MFDFLKNECEIFSPITGEVSPLKEVRDEAFASGMMGCGVVIEPQAEEVIAPCDGEIIQTFDTMHAYYIRYKTIEILIHIGIDTVNLKGQGFKSLVKINQKITLGEKIGFFDIDFIKNKGYNLQTPVVITNSPKINAVYNFGFKTSGKDIIINHKK